MQLAREKKILVCNVALRITLFGVTLLAELHSHYIATAAGLFNLNFADMLMGLAFKFCCYPFVLKFC